MDTCGRLNPRQDRVAGHWSRRLGGATVIVSITRLTPLIPAIALIKILLCVSAVNTPDNVTIPLLTEAFIFAPEPPLF